MKTRESWSQREQRESTDLMGAFLFGAAVSSPFWVTVVGFLVMVKQVGL